MTIVVTGGTGFIGSALVKRLLDQGNNVRLLTRSKAFPFFSQNLEICHCDLLLAKESELANFLNGVDVLYHCAGQLNEPSLMHALHVDGLKKLIKAAVAGGLTHWVQLSSVGVYGPISYGEVTEESSNNPFGAYEISKTEADNILISAAAEHRFHYTILRPSNVYGSTMTNQSLYSMMAMLDRRLFFFIGDLGASANYIHVDNVVEALILCGFKEEAHGRVYNLSDYCTIEHFVEVLSVALGRPFPQVRLPESIARFVGGTFGRINGFPLTLSRVNALTNRSIYSISRIQNELNYKHVMPMDNCLMEMATVYRCRRG